MGSAGGLVGSSEVGGEGTYGDLAGAAFFASGRYAAAFRDRLPRFFLVSGLVWRWCDGGWQEVFVAALHLWLCHQGASLVSDDSDPAGQGRRLALALAMGWCPVHLFVYGFQGWP